jgi:hypothetical protein
MRVVALQKGVKSFHERTIQPVRQVHGIRKKKMDTFFALATYIK